MHQLSDRILSFYEESQESKRLTNDVRIKSLFTITVIACLVFAVTTSLTRSDSENLLNQRKSEVLNMKSELYTMLIPILKVKDLDAEVAFYRALGFELSYNDEDFKAIKYADCIEFGLGRKADVVEGVEKQINGICSS